MESTLKDKYVGKSEEVFLTQFAFDVKVEELKTATNPNLGEKKITIHIYGNNRNQIAIDAKTIYDDVVKRFK